MNKGAKEKRKLYTEFSKGVSLGLLLSPPITHNLLVDERLRHKLNNLGLQPMLPMGKHHVLVYYVITSRYIQILGST
jgi:hypothetical protein